MAAGVMTADRAFKTSHMAHRIQRRVFPPEDVNLDNMSQARDFVQDSVMIFNHNIGTCAMGRVVDEQLRVKGVANLHVVDCSVIPDQISAHTMATVYALAERAADMIRQSL
jgi:choline dehydrogenase-like flavoprotein